MATYDNKIWLLKNIRDAFIATDDTGLCEIVMAGEDLSKIFQNKSIEDKKNIKEGRFNQSILNKGKEGMEDISEDEDEREIVTQFDPYPDMEDSEDDDLMCGSYIRYEEFGGHRQRSNTAALLDKKEQALKKAAKIKVVKWEDNYTMTTEQMAEVFTREEVRKIEKQKSLLTEQIEKCPDLPHHQYLEYAKFDGTAQMGLPTKSFKIYMTILPEKHQIYPLYVCIISNAKIKDLIGFTCYKYSIEHPDIALGSVQNYGLCIADEDGEVDWAFPCLDANEPCSKFGFTCLGLVDLKNKNALAHAPISIPDDGLISKALDVFPKASDSGHSHQNSMRHYTGESTISDTVINALRALKDEKKAAAESEQDKIQSQLMAAEPPQYKTYRVNLLRKVRTNIPVQLVISLDKIEVEPLVQQKHVFWSKSKYFLHSIDSIAWCQILEARANKMTFRIVYSPIHNVSFHDSNTSGGASFFHPTTAYKVHEFECDHDIAKEIVDKINIILDRRNSPCRREYKTAKEKKLQTRRSFHTRHMS
ncbi:stress-activated map kinase-interacting protein 1 isoform X2 [Plodia interpunctella]|uniref:stress-activated map kinase-interacting protein 1 isoform X2 n=1 Tax=Plodia interpunctella TaxID=58824 RepID=UPI002367D9DE|nr:stress-activated map kinase-interacting protein 1 isoform X2 [Plodia interpunctella]